MNEWIVSDPEVLGGKPCIQGTQISVEFILELFATGADRSQVLTKYPEISEGGLTAALAYAAKALKNDIV